MMIKDMKKDGSEVKYRDKCIKSKLKVKEKVKHLKLI